MGVHKRRRSKFWQASYTDTEGTRRYRSTGAESKAEAEEILAGWKKEVARQRRQGSPPEQREALELIQRANRDGAKGRLTHDAARAYLIDLQRVYDPIGMALHTVRSWTEAWLEDRQHHVKDSSLRRFSLSIRHILKCLGDVADKPLELLTSDHVRRAQSALRAMKNRGTSLPKTSTINQKMDDFRTCLNSAMRDGLLLRNVASSVERLPEEDSETRAPFSPAEVQLLVNQAETIEWKGVVLLSFFTGLRLGDVTRLSWEQVDLDKKQFVLATTKQRRAKGRRRKVTAIPMRAEVFAFFDHLDARGNGKGDVFPSLSVLSTSTHSLRFRKLMESAGVEREVLLPGGELGVRTFHSLRHGFVTGLANRGVAAEIRQELAAHTDAASHAIYTHLNREQLQAAIDKLPSIKVAYPAA